MTVNFNGWKDLMPKPAMAEKVLGQALKYPGQDTDKNARYFLIAVDNIASGKRQEMVQMVSSQNPPIAIENRIKEPISSKFPRIGQCQGKTLTL